MKRQMSNRSGDELFQARSGESLPEWYARVADLDTRGLS
jgi:hypothetical protein